MQIARRAFTILELLVVLFLIGLATTIFLPFFSRRSPRVEWTTIVDEMSTLAMFARQEAITNKKVHRLVFKSNTQGPDTLWIEEENDDPDHYGHKVYTPISSYYLSTRYSFAEQVKIKAVYLGKTNILDEGKGVAYCYIIADGLIQDIVVQLVRKIDTVEAAATFKMNPFFGRFDFQDGLIRPER